MKKTFFSSIIALLIGFGLGAGYMYCSGKMKIVSVADLEKTDGLVQSFYSELAQTATDLEKTNELVLSLSSELAQTIKPQEIAVVDVPYIVDKSEQVAALRETQDAKAMEISKWLDDIQNEIQEEPDSEKRKSLLQAYKSQFEAKKTEIAQQYNEKLHEVDQNITKTITDEAKKRGYKLVLPKGLAIYGGVDITEDIAKIIK